MPENRLDTISLKIDGRPLDVDLYTALTMLRVEESVHLPDVFTIHFDDPYFDLFDTKTFQMGAAIEIAFRAEEELMIVTNGEITAMTIQQGLTGRHELVLTGLDATHRLHKSPKSRSFNGMTDGDIVEQIASEHRLEVDSDPTPETHQHLIQTNQTNLTFLQSRARKLGFDLWVATDTLHFKQSPRANGTPPRLVWGDNLTRFRVRFASADRCDQVTVRGADPIRNTEILGRAEEGDPGTDAPAAAQIAEEARRAFGDVERSAGQFPVASQREADALAKSLLLRASGGEVVLRGESVGDPRLSAGARVEIAHVGDRLSGTYQVTSVEHIYGTGSPYVTKFTCGAKDPTTMVDLLSGGPAGEKKGWGSLVRATVTDTRDPEQLGRVQVTFVDLDDTVSDWAYVVSPGAGKDSGLQALPLVGDNVVVGFEHDDHRRPLVLGGLWSQNLRPPLPENPADRTLRTESGTHLTMEHDQTNLTMALGNDAARLAFEEDGKVLLDANTELTIKAGQKLVLDAPQVEINGSSTVTVKGGVIQLN